MIGDAGAAGEADLAVDDEDLPMGAEVQALRRVPAGGIERQDARTGLLQALDVFVVHRAAPTASTTAVTVTPRRAARSSAAVNLSAISPDS